MRVSSSALIRRVLRGAPYEVLLDHDHLTLTRRGDVARIERARVQGLTGTTGWFWDSLRIELMSGETHVLRGLPRGAGRTAARVWAAWGMAPRAAAAADALRALLERDTYITRSALDAWHRTWGSLASRLPAALDDLPVSEEVRRALQDGRRSLAEADALVDARNDAFVQQKMAEHGAWFAAAGGRFGLSAEQQEAILRDEDNILVVAGAGTGKTSTVAGKVGYLLRTGAARPDQILLLSFTKKAVTEMAERLASLPGVGAAASAVRVATFHGLGVDIVAQADGARPSLSRFADDPRALVSAIRGYLQALARDPATRTEVIEFFAYYRYPYRSPFEFETGHAYHQYLRGHDMRTLKGERVRSHEEVMIANWLFLHGVRYEYERAYPHDTATVRYRKYRPDFYLPDFDVYLEHFGVNRSGETAPWIDRTEYLEGMAWKRATHRQFGTRLVETYSYERMEGVLFDALETKLRAAGVTLGAEPSTEVLTDAEGAGAPDPVTRLLATFLNLYKANGWTSVELEQAVRMPAVAGRAGQDTSRTLAFVRIFWQVLARYEAELAAAREIDFNDMIALATERVASGRFVSPWTHVIVDECQDLSRGRARLLTALLAQVPERRLFCVGDDWQSIYRFTGSDIDQMLTFSDQFGVTRRCDLTRTHRFSHELLAASSVFVQRNPQQLRKTLTARRSLGGPAVEILASRPDEGTDRTLDQALTRIATYAVREQQRGPGTTPTVLVLGRYHSTKPAGWSRLVQRHADLVITFMTVHASKGLEADYVVLLDVVSGRMGFPSEVVDDPVLDLVLAGAVTYPHAEERRLFYVALTRARTRCLILTDEARPSVFVEELEGAAYRAWVTSADDAVGAAPVIACPICRGGRLLRRDGAFGAFWTCSNHPLCAGRGRRCPACDAGPLVRQDEDFRCLSAGCGHVAPCCPACRVGALVERRGRVGRFLGCTEWRPDGAGPSCTFTRDLGDAAQTRRRPRS